MRETVKLTDPRLEIPVRRVARARRISLRVANVGGVVTLTMPPGVRLAQAQRFAEERAGWIRDQLRKAVQSQVVAPGGSLPVFGVPHRIEQGVGSGVVLCDNVLEVPRLQPCGPSLRGFLRETARVHLVAASDRYARRVGRSYGRVTLRDTRSRWGSCSGQGNLMYSWRLVMAPLPVLEYVAAHEVAHLVHMDHSNRFWRCVEGLCPDWRRHRDWLRQNGSTLHAYHFGD